MAIDDAGAPRLCCAVKCAYNNPDFRGIYGYPIITAAVERWLQAGPAEFPNYIDRPRPSDQRAHFMLGGPRTSDLRGASASRSGGRGHGSVFRRSAAWRFGSLRADYLPDGSGRDGNTYREYRGDRRGRSGSARHLGDVKGDAGRVSEHKGKFRYPSTAGNTGAVERPPAKNRAVLRSHANIVAPSPN